MKIRTDFVTNSSDSSFLAFNIKNKRLFQSLTALGIRFEDVEEGNFDDRMKIVLPSGRSMEIDGTNNRDYPYATDYATISEWLVALLLWEIGKLDFLAPDKDEFDDDDLPGEDSGYSGFTRELVELFNKYDITHLNWETVEDWSRKDIDPDLHKKFGDMDEDMETSVIEHTYGFEGEVGPCIYITSEKGQRMVVDYANAMVYRKDCDGLTFVVTGKLKYYKNREEIAEFIQENGGCISESISKNTDYLVCNDIGSNSSKMKKAKALGIPVLTELAFIRMFADIDEFEEGQKMVVVHTDSQDCDGLTFVVPEKLKYYYNREAITAFIENNGGVISEIVSEETDYLVCNDIESNSSNMKKAKALGIPVLTELQFIAMFDDDLSWDITEDGEAVLDDDVLYERAWDLASYGGTFGFVEENGIQPIVMQVWKDGKWISNK